jgi:hypothetical protein
MGFAQARWDPENSVKSFAVALGIVWVLAFLCVFLKIKGVLISVNPFDSRNPSWSDHYLGIPYCGAGIFALNEWLNVCFNAVLKSRDYPQSKIKRRWWDFDWAVGGEYGVDYWRRKPIHWLKLLSTSVAFGLTCYGIYLIG